jgi:hypothetical protein
MQMKPHSEKKETPAMEARMHPKKFLVAALRKKSSPSTGGTTQGTGIAGAGSNSGAGSAA